MRLRIRTSLCSLCVGLALSMASGVARGDWAEIDTFQSMAVDSPLDGQNGWTAPEAGDATRRVILDPSGGPNQVLSIFETATGTFNLYKQALLPAGGAGTLYFRMRFGDYDELVVNGPSVGIGMDNTAAPTGSPNVAGPFIVNDGNSGLNEITIDTDTSSASNFVPLQALDVETWYSVWMVINNASSQFEIYVQGGAFGSPTIVDDPSANTAHTYREPSTDDLLSVWIRPNNEHGVAPGQTMYFDDIYLDATGSNLTIPMPTMNPPGDVNMDGFVDIFDVNEVSAHWGGIGPAGDANGDMMVDIFDVNLISANWSPPPAPGAGAAVPEPATLGLATLAAAGLCIAMRRKRT